MEGNFSQGGMVPVGSSYGGFDLQGSMRGHHLNTMHPNQHHSNSQPDSSGCPPHHEGVSLPLTVVSGQMCNHNTSAAEKGKVSVSDDDEPIITEDGGDEAKMGSPWHRVKWTSKMVKLLITAVSYIGDDSAMDNGIRRKFVVLQKKGKWKTVSKVMDERGYHVSPQQCEDKFNDMNKRYKKLNDMIGRGTTCQVVENPALLDMLDYLSEKEKDDVRKILSSKHLFYEEMCSYHNGNRLYLPHDPALQHSLQLALRNRDDHDNDSSRKHHTENIDDEDHDVEADDDDVCDGHHSVHGDGKVIMHHAVQGGPSKRLRRGPSHEDVCCPKPANSHECSKGSLPESGRAAWVQKQWIESRAIQLEEQKLLIKAELLELEKQRFKWERFCKRRDQELEKMRTENERMKIENDRMALELKRKELSADL